MYRILEMLRKEKDFLSGEEIGQRLEISRAAVWKGIKKLREEGYEIEAVTNKGYHLVLHDAVYNEKEIVDGLKTKVFGKPLYFYKETDSTNERIRELALTGGEEGTLAVAEIQTAGRGRRGRKWEAPSGTGVWMSLLLRPAIRPSQASALTLLAAIAVCKGIAAETGIQAEIKWPNDILLNGKKLVGILTEMECEMHETHFVTVGIGINANIQEFSRELQELATSLYLESGELCSRKGLVQNTLLAFEEIYEKFLAEGCRFDPFVEEYKTRCINIGKGVTVIGKETFAAVAQDITADGELVVTREDNGQEEIVFSGEVSIRGRN